MNKDYSTENMSYVVDGFSVTLGMIRNELHDIVEELRKLNKVISSGVSVDANLKEE